MLCRDVLQDEVIPSIFVAQVVYNKVNTHPVIPIVTTPASAAPAGGTTTGQMQAPVTTPQQSGTQNQQPEKPVTQ
jgi:hypothetical protein